MTAPIINPLPYDKTSPDSILSYAKKLKWKTFSQVLEEDKNLNEEQKDIIRKQFSMPKNKWWYGHFIEENFFYYNKNSNNEADFPEAWVELKVSPYERNSKWLRAKERLVLTIINFMNDYKIPFENSHLLEKCALMLLIYYFYDKNKADDDYLINYVDLFQFPETDYEIIKSDYNKIIKKIADWKAHELSEWDTIYLWACTKWADSSVMREQPNSPIPAKQRAFCLKNSYMTMILNEYLAKGIHTYKIKEDFIKQQLYWLRNEITYGKVVKDKEILKEKWFENYIISKLEKYYGCNASNLLKQFWVDSISKSNYYILAKKMLWVNEDRIEEFDKANIEIKTIRLKSNWVPKEAMSFPAFKYMEIINQDYYDSDLYNLFYESKFLFMIFQYTDIKQSNLVFKKAMFWNVPWCDLEWNIKTAWNETKNRIIWWEYDKLITIKDDMIIHVRPHWINSKDKFPTPDWWTATKKCFWLNQKYIKEQIEKGGN